MAILLFVLGIVVWSLTQKYSNNFPKLTQQHCPALNGKIYDWTTNLDNILIALAFLVSVQVELFRRFFLESNFEWNLCVAATFLWAFLDWS